MTPVEAAMFLRLDQIGHTPKSAKRTLDYWRNHDELKATKFAKHVWYLKKSLRNSWSIRPKKECDKYVYFFSKKIFALFNLIL